MGYFSIIVETRNLEQTVNKINKLIKAFEKDRFADVDILGAVKSRENITYDREIFGKTIGSATIRSDRQYVLVGGSDGYIDQVTHGLKRDHTLWEIDRTTAQTIGAAQKLSQTNNGIGDDGRLIFIADPTRGFENKTEQAKNQTRELSKARQALVDRVLSRLDAGAMPWDNGMQGFTAPFNAVSKTHYRGMNVLNLMLSGKSDPRWLTFNQAKDNGYTVKKGAKGVPIELYKTIDKRTGKEADWDKIRDEVKDMTFAEKQEFKKENLQSFARSYYVFNASDVHGIEPYRAPVLSPADISARNERIERVIENSAAPIFYDGNGRNFYRRSDDEIHLTERTAFTSDEFFYNTALHDMAHSTGHNTRLNRAMGDGFGSKSYAREELVAEMASVLTAAEFGLDHSERVIENSAEYVRSWAQLIREDPQTLIDAAFDASRATDYICDRERQRERANESNAQKESTVSEQYSKYQSVQAQHPDAVVLQRLGDFYEVLGDKARTVAAELDLTLTGRNVGLPERVPMCGFPNHVAEKYIEKIRQNHAVAIIETADNVAYMPSTQVAQRTPLEASAQKESLQSNVRDWYSHTYPTDELVDVLNAETTFGTVRDAINNGKDIYDILGSNDSVVRERVFRELSNVLDVPYKAVYDKWSEADRSEPAPKTAAPNQVHEKPLVVNFFAGPGAGKTTAALELTAALKKAGYTVEYVSEYAKQLVLEGRADELKDQKKVTDGQYALLDRIRGTTDIIVTDIPVLLGLVYGEFNDITPEYAKQIRGYYDSFDNFNMLVNRPNGAAFQTEGRVHNEKQSIELDGKIEAMLKAQGVFYGSYKRDDIAKTVERIGTTYKRLYGENKQEKTQKEKVKPSPAKPSEFKTKLDNIPDAMKALPNWVAFRTETLEDGKVKKILLSPNKGASAVEYLKWAKSDDPTTWATFDKAAAFAKKYKLAGLAFAMSGSGMTCIDLDHHLDENGKPSELAQKYITAAQGTYVERSVSGRGLHIFYAGTRPQDRQNRNIKLDLETYDDKRFMSMTGDIYGAAPKTVAEPSAELKNLLASNLEKLSQYSAPSAPLGFDDNALIEKIRSSKRGADFDALWRGEIILYKADGSPDPSRCDYMLCNMLGFFSGGDVAQVERLIKASGLRRPDKPDKYYELTARKACAGLNKFYTPPTRDNSTKRNYGKPSGAGNGGRGSSGR